MMNSRELRIAKEIFREEISGEKNTGINNIGDGFKDLVKSPANPQKPNSIRKKSKELSKRVKNFQKQEEKTASRTVTAYEKPKLLSAAEDRLVTLYMTAYDADLYPSDLITYAKDFREETDKASKALLSLQLLDWDTRINKVVNSKNIIMLVCELSGDFTKKEAQEALLDLSDHGYLI